MVTSITLLTSLLNTAISFHWHCWFSLETCPVSPLHTRSTSEHFYRLLKFFIPSSCLWTHDFSHFFQWLLGLGFFLFPWASAQLRSWYLPLHVFFGLLLLAMSVGTCLLGITEKLLFSIMWVSVDVANHFLEITTDVTKFWMGEKEWVTVRMSHSKKRRSVNINDTWLLFSIHCGASNAIHCVTQE